MWRIPAMRAAAAAMSRRAIGGTRATGRTAANSPHSHSRDAESLRRAPAVSCLAPSASRCLSFLAVTVAVLLSAGSALAAAVRTLPPIGLQLHRSASHHSHQPLPGLSPQQRGQPPMPVTSQSKSTPPQPLGFCGSLSHWKERLQRGWQQWQAERAADRSQLPMSPPQERGWIGAAVLVSWWSAVKFEQKLDENRFAGGAEHWDLQAYKRGGGQAHAQPLPLDTPDTDLIQALDLMNGLPFYLGVFCRAMDGAIVPLPNPKSVELSIRSQPGTLQNASVDPGRHTAERNFIKLHERACRAHEIAEFLIDNPRDWKVPDAVRLRIARRSLLAALDESDRTLRYSAQNGVSHSGWCLWTDAPTRDRILRLHTWLLFRNLLDGQARLGLRDDFERTAARFTRAVEARCASVSPTRNAAALDPESQLLLQFESLQLIAQRRVRLHQVRGEWAKCAEQHIAVLGNMAEQAWRFGLRGKWWHRKSRSTGTPTSWELGLRLRMQMASELAALSHARLQQPSSSSVSAAVLEAQHAVALLHANDDDGGPMLLQLRAALDATASGQSAHVNARVGDVSYDKLLSPSVLDQVRSREAAAPGLKQRGFFMHILELAALIDAPALPRVRAHAQLTAVAAIYQQLGLALRASGVEVEAQRAIDFADEIARMRPTVSRSGLRVQGIRFFKWHWLGMAVFVLPLLGVIVTFHKLDEQWHVMPALHADSEDYKRGGGCRQPACPAAVTRCSQL